MRIYISELVVVGAGGTGTFFLKEVSRFIASLGGQSPVGRMTIIDGDIVEKKNMDRQCFQEEDIGLYKASVMADLLNTAFSLSWNAQTMFLESKDQLNISRYKNPAAMVSLPVLIGCVDNHPCRMVLERYFRSCRNCIYLDSANEYMSGEVVFSMKLKGKVFSPVRSSYFPEVKKKQKKRSELSCTELNMVSPQHIAANMIAGNILLSEFAAICTGTFHGGMVVFDSKDFIVKHIPYSAEQLQTGKRIMEKERRVDAEKFLSLLDLRNSVDFSEEIDLPIQIAIQSKLIQVVKKRMGLYTGELGFFDALGSIHKRKMFVECSIPRLVYDYEDFAEEMRLEVCQFWTPNSSYEIYDCGIFPEDITYDILFLTDTWLLEREGTCITDSPVLEEMVEDAVGEFSAYVDEAEPGMIQRLAYLLRQMDFCFSGKVDPVVREVSEYIDSLYFFVGEMMPREEIVKWHEIFYLIYAYGSECLVTLVSSKDTAEYYKYRDRIPDSDPRKRIADKAVDIFWHPISSDKEGGLWGSWDAVIERPDKHIVICYYGESEQSNVEVPRAIMNPFYVDAIQIVETLLPALKEEYSREEV